MFGLQHEQDPRKDDYEFLLMLDNDIILTPGWDLELKRAWKYIRKNKLKHVKVVGQLPGGIKSKKEEHKISDDLIGRVGVLGGSGLWSVRSNFFRDVGYLNLNELVNHNKRHDQLYWRSLQKASGGRPYIMGINKKLGVHCGKLAGSICNTLTRERNKAKAMERIKFEKGDANIREMDFDTFYTKIHKDKQLIGDW
jgi:hypothetical protein